MDGDDGNDGTMRYPTQAGCVPAAAAMRGSVQQQRQQPAAVCMKSAGGRVHSGGACSVAMVCPAAQ
jgi:hypothetical protein